VRAGFAAKRRTIISTLATERTRNGGAVGEEVEAMCLV